MACKAWYGWSLPPQRFALFTAPLPQLVVVDLDGDLAAAAAAVAPLLQDGRVASLPMLVLGHTRAAPVPGAAEPLLPMLSLAPHGAMARAVSAADPAACRAALEDFAGRFGYFAAA